MIKVGILGMGFMGRGHFDRIQNMPDVQVTAVADVERERRQGQIMVEGNIDLGLKPLDFGEVESYMRAEQLIEEADVEVIDICLPTYLHSRHAVAALNAGKHVFCEKPMALNLEQADAMLEAARRSGRLLMIGHCIRFWPEYVYLKKLIDSGELGALLSLRMSRLGTAPLWSWRGWMLEAQRSGSALLDLHVHDVDFVHYLLGKPRLIAAQGGNVGTSKGYDMVMAAYYYDQIPRVTIEAGWMRAGLGFQASYDAWFERGFVTYRGWEKPTLTVYPNDVQGEQHPEIEPSDAYTNELRYFFDCMREGKAPERCLPEQAREALALVIKERESIQERAPVQIS